MKYLIDANVFAKKAFDIAYPIVAVHNDHERGLTLSGIAQLLDEMQPVDAVPVIRCKDCRFWEQERRNKKCGDCMYHLSLTQASDFCSFSERKKQ